MKKLFSLAFVLGLGLNLSTTEAFNPKFDGSRTTVECEKFDYECLKAQSEAELIRAQRIQRKHRLFEYFEDLEAKNSINQRILHELNKRSRNTKNTSSFRPRINKPIQGRERIRTFSAGNNIAPNNYKSVFRNRLVDIFVNDGFGDRNAFRPVYSSTHRSQVPRLLLERQVQKESTKPSNRPKHRLLENTKGHFDRFGAGQTRSYSPNIRTTANRGFFVNQALADVGIYRDELPPTVIRGIQRSQDFDFAESDLLRDLDGRR